MSADVVTDPRVAKVAAVKCYSSLMFFTRYFFKKRFNRKFVIGEHHLLICEALEKVYRGECNRLIINIAPRYGKTELAVKNFIACGLALNPAAKFIHLSYSDILALDNSEEVKDMITDVEYQQLFPNVQLKKDSKAKKKWYTTESGGVYATSADGQLTGFGAGVVDEEDADLTEFLTDIETKQGFGGAIVIDDPIKPEDANSEVKRTKVNQRYDSTIKNRVNSRKTPIIIIMQRLHEEDLCGYVENAEPGEWTILRLSSIKDDGTALWPFKHTIEELNALWKLNAIVFEGQHLQRPKPREGLLYKSLKTYEVLPGFRKKRKAKVDTADTGDDYLCAIIYDEYENGECYLIDVLYTDKGMEITEPETATLLSKYEVEQARFESNNGGRGFARNVERLCREMGNRKTSVSWFHQTENKEVRIFTKAAEVQNMILFPHNWALLWPAFYKSVTGYLAKGKNKNDDAEDVLTMIVEDIPNKNNNLKGKLGYFR